MTYPVDRQISPPSMDEICEMFEFLDENRHGTISANDLVYMLELSERLKSSQFDLKNFIKHKNQRSQQMENKLS